MKAVAEDYEKESRLRILNDKYSMSFTDISLLHHKSLRMAVLYFDLRGRGSFRDKVIVENMGKALLDEIRKTNSNLKKIAI